MCGLSKTRIMVAPHTRLRIFRSGGAFYNTHLITRAADHQMEAMRAVGGEVERSSTPTYTVMPPAPRLSASAIAPAQLASGALRKRGCWFIPIIKVGGRVDELVLPSAAIIAQARL